MTKLAALTVFTRLPPDNHLNLIVDFQHIKTVIRDEVTLRKIIKPGKIQSALKEMHKEVSQRRTTSREETVRKHNQKMNIQPIHFIIGILYFVLVAKEATND